jgi:predicted RNA-binding Zn ribbon-like protein
MAEVTQAQRRDAPEQLELVRRFVNSRYVDEQRDSLDTPESLRGWLADHELMDGGEPVSDGDLRRALDVREGLRALMLANNDEELDRAAVERLDRAASRAGLRPRFEPGAEPLLEPDASGVDGALARLLAIVNRAVADGSWQRLKACPNESCLWAFYDRSKNQSKRWCKMEACGNAAKARAYRRRQAAQA